MKLCNCGKPSRQEKGGYCVECHSEYMRAYNKNYYALRRATMLERAKKWNRDNPDRVKEKNARHHRENREKRIEYMRERRRDPEVKQRLLNYNRKYLREHPEQNKANSNNRRSRKLAAVGVLSRRDWETIKAEQRNRCFDCGKLCKLTIGHLIPLTKGGSNMPVNIVGQCQSCNSKQHDKIHPKAAVSLFDKVSVCHF